MAEAAYAAVDLGAESGRVIIGRFSADRVQLELVHRFPNRPVRLADGLHWDLPGLFEDVLEGLGRAVTSVSLRGVGVDAWGVDYALLDGQRQILGLPFHHRDARTDGIVARVHERVTREELYATTGIQTMPINTVFQLFAERDSSASLAAERLVLISDLVGFWLTGELANEVTAASTTGLLDARSGTWARGIIERLGLPSAPFAIDPIEPATTLGPVLDAHEGFGAGVALHAIAGHDTASAFAGAPVRSPRAAVISSGTWSLVGLELDEPILTPEACAFNITNERGVDGTIRLLRNVMGLWLLQECRRDWGLAGASYQYDELQHLAATAAADVAVFDPDDDRFLAPDGMPARIAAACRESGQVPPTTPAEITRSVLLSLTCKYRLVLERLERVSGRDIEVVHVIGGGASNALLCRMTAEMLGRPVLAGPVEATALGNVLVQARATGELSSLTEMREVAAATADLTVYEPGERRASTEDDYRRFLNVTGLAVDAAEPAVA